MADDAFRDVRSPDHLNETAPLHGNDSADPTVVSAVPQHPTAPRDEQLSAASDACRHAREDLAALRAYVHSATAEQSKWIMKMNRVVKKVVPALSNAMVTNGPMPEDALRWLHGVADHAAGRPGSSSIHSSVVGGRSPCPTSVTGSPTEVAMEQTAAIAPDGQSHAATADHEDCTDTSATHQVLHTIVPGVGNTAERSGGLVSKRGSVFLDSESSPVQLDPVLVPKGSSSSLRQHVQGSGAPSGAASADGSMSQYPGSSISHLEGMAPSGERELLTTQDTLGAPLTTTTGGLVAAAPPSSPPQLLGSHGRSLKRGAHAHHVAAALAALDEHASYHADQHHQRSGRDASTLSQRVQGTRCRVPALSQVVPSGGPVLTMSCYGAPSNEHTYDATGNSPRAPLPVHPWSIGTSTRHAQLLIEAQLAASLHLSTAQLRAISPLRLEALLQDLSGHSHNAATSSTHNAAHALRPLSDAAVVGASLSAMGLASSVGQRLPSPTKDASVSAGLRTDSGGMQTVTPLTSLYQLAHQATPYHSQQAFPVPIGVPLLRTSGPPTFGTSPRVITAATSPPAPALATTTAVAAATTAMTAPAPAPPIRATVSAQSARIKKGLVMTSNLRTTAGVHVTPPAGIRGGVVNSSRPSEAPSKGAVVPAAGTTGVGRNHSSLGLTAWTPPMPHIVGPPK